MKKNSLIILVVVIVIIVIALIALLLGTSSSTGDKSGDDAVSETTNTTDLNSLKSSEYTSDAFDNVNIGDSKETVSETMGATLEEKGKSEEGYDVYYTSDDSSIYYFFFDNDSLKEVSVVLK